MTNGQRTFLLALTRGMKYALMGLIIIGGIILLSSSNPTPHMIASIAAMIGFLIVYNTLLLEDNVFIEGIKRDLRTAEIQELILKETKDGKDQTIKIISSQAKLLEKMTNIAVNKTKD
jgi:hypothetical protein